MNAWPQNHCSQRFSVLLTIVATALNFASSANGQRLTPFPSALALPNSQEPLPAQKLPYPQMRRIQAKPVVKPSLISEKPFTKAQLNQALIAEAYRRDTAHVAGLLAQGANPNASDKAGVPVLFYAVAVKGNIPVILLLLGKGANVNARDPRGNTVLAEAVQLGNGPVVALLLQRKADPNVRNGAGFTPLGIATAESGLATMHLLLAHGANPNAPQRGGVTPLVMAVSLGNPEIVRLLAEARAVVNPSTSTHPGASSGRISAPSVAVESRSLYREAVLLELLDHGADDNGRDAQNNPPLVASVSGGGFCRSAATQNLAEVAFGRVDQ